MLYFLSTQHNHSNYKVGDYTHENTVQKKYEVINTCDKTCIKYIIIVLSTPSSPAPYFRILNEKKYFF